jgi:NitT/TauT family transport system substrate-binding protein
VAEEKGIFTKHGLDVDLKYFESYLDSLNALATGNIDGNSQTLNDTISSVSGGSKQSIVLTNDNSTGNDQIIVSAEITKVEDLKGKKVAIEEGTVDDYLLALGLQRAGLTPSDISRQNLPTDQAAAAFASGQVDGVGAFAPFTDTAITREGSHILFSSADFPGAIPDHLVMDTAFVDKRPGDVQKLIDAWYETLDYIAANPDESIAIMAKRAGVTPEAYRDYDAGTTIFTVADNVEGFTPGNDQKHLDFVARQIVDLLVSTKLIDTAPDLTGMLDPTFITARAAAG